MQQHEFQEQVIADLAGLKVQMKQLVGNGQPGRIKLIEDDVAALLTLSNEGVGEKRANAAFKTALLAIILAIIDGGLQVMAMVRK